MSLHTVVVVVAVLGFIATPAHAQVTYEIAPVSVRQDGGATASAASQFGGLGADGTIAFGSTSSGIVGGPANGFRQTYAHDGSGVTLLSRSPAGLPGNADTFTLAASRDGRYVLLQSRATNLVANFVNRTPGELQAYRVDRDTGQIELLSHVPGSAATPGNDTSFAPITGASGQCVAFRSEATDLTPHPTAAPSSAFVWIDGNVELVSGNVAGTATANAAAAPVALSADCRYVAFTTAATDVVAGANGSTQVYLRDRVAGTTTLVSHGAASSSAPGNAASSAGAMSPDARFVVFPSRATNLVAGQVDTANSLDVFLWERDTGAIRLVSHASGLPAQAANGASTTGFQSQLSDDGTRIAYYSEATNLVTATDSNADFDAFLWRAETGTSLLLSRSTQGDATGNAGSLAEFVSADGRYVGISSDASDLVAGVTDTNGTTDAFVYDVPAATLRAVSLRRGASQTGNGGSSPRAASPDGTFVALISDATDVSAVPDTNANTDVFRAVRTETLFANGFE